MVNVAVNHPSFQKMFLSILPCFLYPSTSTTPHLPHHLSPKRLDQSLQLLLPCGRRHPEDVRGVVGVHRAQALQIALRMDGLKSSLDGDEDGFVDFLGGIWIKVMAKTSQPWTNSLNKSKMTRSISRHLSPLPHQPHQTYLSDPIRPRRGRAVRRSSRRPRCGPLSPRPR